MALISTICTPNKFDLQPFSEARGPLFPSPKLEILKGKKLCTEKEGDEGEEQEGTEEREDLEIME